MRSIVQLKFKRVSVILFSLTVFAVFSLEAHKTLKVTEVAAAQFDPVEFGRIDKSELEVSFKVLQKDSDILVALIFENVSKRELNINSTLWFTQLSVSVNGKPSNYKGPSVSRPAPQKKDFQVIKPGQTWITEAILLNSYYSLTKLPGTECVLSFEFRNNTPKAEVRFVLK